MQVLQYLIVKIIFKKLILKHLKEMQVYGFKTTYMQKWIACTLNTLNCPQILLRAPRMTHFLFCEQQMQFFTNDTMWRLAFKCKCQHVWCIGNRSDNFTQPAHGYHMRLCVNLNLPMSSCSPLMNQQLLFFFQPLFCFYNVDFIQKVFLFCNDKLYFHNTFF